MKRITLSIITAFWTVCGAFSLETPEIALDCFYFGETAMYPGAGLGADLALLQGGGHNLLARVELGGFIHPRNYRALYGGADLAYEYRFRFGLGLRAETGIAYLHTFLDGTVYEFKNGEAGVVQDPGRPAFMPSLKLGLSWEWAGLYSMFLRLGAFGQYPFNSYMLIRPEVQAGFSYKITGGTHEKK